MTKETINLIIEWFAHIEQLATDRKTQTGVVMDKQHCLDEIAAMASRCKQFVNEYKDEPEPIDEEELDKLANLHVKELEKLGCEFNSQERLIVIDTYKAGYRKAMEEE